MTLDRAIVVEALPSYVVEDELGRGTFGIVLAGRHRTLERQVAIKQLPRAFGSDPMMRKRFHAEARVLASLDFPHIVHVYDFVEHEGVCLIVMELLTGGTLSARMRGGPMDPRIACAVAIAGSAGLSHAHARGVLHRDIKPDNLMFSGDSVLKVTDFGIAKLVDAKASVLTQNGYVLGTTAYMAPEQAEGGAVVPATDVYALGTVLYEMLSGELPYPEASSTAAALYQHVYVDPRPLLDAAPRLAPRLAQVVDRAIARDLAVRYGSAADFAGELADAAAALWGDGWMSRADVPPLRGSLPPARAAAATTEAPIAARATRRPSPRPLGDTLSGTPVPAGAPTVAVTPPPPTLPGRKVSRRAAVAAGAIVLVAGGTIAAVTLRGSGTPAGSSSSRSGGRTGAGPAGAVGYTVAPTSGPIGTTVTVTSTNRCPARPAADKKPEFAYVSLVDPRQVTKTETGVVYADQVPLNADRSWRTQVDIPGDTTPGPTHFKVSCAATSRAGDPDLYYDYPSASFTVTGRPAVSGSR